MKLEAGKKYKDRSGNVVEIIRTDLKSIYPCMGIKTFNDGTQCPMSYKGDGTYKSVESSMDLVSEITPFDDYEIDEPVVVWDGRNVPYFRYFAGVEDGNACVWRNGATSWSSTHNGKLKWPHCIRFSEYIPEAHGHKK